MAKNLAPWWVPAGAPDLQKARREAADRYYAIGMSYLPEGWTHSFCKGLYGRCSWHKKHVHGPKPVTRKSLYIWLHECAHAHLHTRRVKAHVQEHEAEVWAHAKMREHGIAVPKEMTKRAKQYVAHKIDQALRHGAKPDNISRAAVRFASKRSAK